MSTAITAMSRIQTNGLRKNRFRSGVGFPASTTRFLLRSSRIRGLDHFVPIIRKYTARAWNVLREALDCRAL
ncbi:hypothetical protein GCM10028833_14210 [Glycomyces tarimensis]